jgi:hypothetical protein
MPRIDRRSAAVACTLLVSLAAFAQADPQPFDAAAASLPPGAQVDCTAVAAQPSSPLSLEACRQMMAGAGQAQSALADARGARAGDTAMNCQDISAEMGTLQGIGLSRQSRAESDAASTQYQQTMAAQLAQLRQQAAAGAVAVTTAAAADMALQLATGGLVSGHAAQATQQAAIAQGRVQGDRMAEERRPAEQRLANATSHDTAEMARQLQANPRFARLVELALAKGCR